MTHPAYLRYPHLHGELIAFTAEDDVWVAPLDGGRAWRVSADNMPVNHPRISPDGTRIAWSSYRDGTPEVHLAPVDGGPSERLTHWGSHKTSVRGWTPDGRVLALTSSGQASLRRTWAHAVPLDGGPADVLPYGPVGGVAYGPRTLLLSATMGREAAAWKRYRGGTAGKLWIEGETEGEFVRLHEDIDGNVEYPLWVGERVAFLSDHEGVGALYSSLPDGSDLRRHTGLDGFYARHAATDGIRVAYACAGELWLLDGLDGEQPRRLDIRLGGQRTDLQPRPIDAGHHLGAADPDHTGRGSAVEIRGGIHWVTHREGPARSLAVEPGVRARLPRTFGVEGEQYVVWVTDAEGDDALEFAPATGTAAGATPRRLAAGRLGRVLALAVAPDGSRAAVASHDGRVLLVERETGEVREVDRSEHGDADGLVFSPDSAWLAWSHPGPSPLRQIKLANTGDLSVSEATPLRFADFQPAFTLDGKHLAFLSERAFDPVYDAHVFDLAFVGGCRPHLITLAATTPSPFGPQRHGRPFEADKDGSSDGDEGSAPVTRIDLDGLADRIVPFPVEAASYSTLRAAKDGLLWLRHPLRGVLGAGRATPDDPGPRTTLERYDLGQQRVEELASDASYFRVSGDGKRVLLYTGDKLKVVPSDREASHDDGNDSAASITVDLSRVRRTVEPAAEWRQMYDEAGRLMRDHFWRPDLGGVDWAGVLERYRPVLDRVATHDDLVDLLWEVQGELGTSHAYVVPHGGHGDASTRQGLLGADISRTEEGSWRIDRILPSESSDPHAHSPLAAPGVALRAGDTLLAVDGRPVDPVRGPGPLLVGAAGKAVELTVSPAGGGDPRHAVVVPIADEEPLRYHAWVADRRAYVHEKSGGRLGYLHVPDMQAPGWAQIHRDLRVEVAKDGLVVDVRENRGGHTSQLVVEKLARRIVGWDLPRGMRPSSYPLDAPRGPVVAVANEFSGSDGDIVNAAIKALGIGPVVGTRTWGGVVGIDSRYSLVDGTLVTQPKYAFWLEGYGWEVENRGVDPDVEVVHAPQDHAAGRDPQLDEAVRLALEALASTPAKQPPSLP
ncbi:S41 family peptidase [Streptomyces pristinaespiralis]|uniref:Tricorn protease homolog n=2 Tax=Streptomyces pristinaespiralis TaxID=38300 RepID=B5H740_STRE2|nr:S41 family peptidase [Streptomyces pristinaespiralis]ALC23279.1 peptidase S41 [Streptomyces pristinaespiralis]EDY62651.1 protease [Streptomyces pristinaespiralis ATCC 25486]QMU14233.1 PDZ domain-containing protein [Streptomyces pristinaespiralis]